MTRYILKRLVQIAATLVLFHALLFFLLAAQPGDSLDADFPPGSSPEVLEKHRRYLGLDQPVHLRYLSSLRNIVTGNLGVSYSLHPRTVAEIIRERLPRTIVLFATATTLSFYLGFALGKIIAWRRGGVIEQVATLSGVSLYTVFTPWFALMIIWAFAFKAGWFPLGKFLDPVLWRDAPVDANHVFVRILLSIFGVAALAIIAKLAAPRIPGGARKAIVPGVALTGIAVTLVLWDSANIGYLAADILRHMALPVLTLTLISFGGTMLLTRNSMLDTMGEDFVLAARAKGLTEKEVRDRHVARNALLPVVTSLIFSLAFAIDGGIIIENIFSWPGMGMTLVGAAQSKDIPLAIGTFGLIGLLALVAHLIADVSYAYLDPRIRY